MAFGRNAPDCFKILLDDAARIGLGVRGKHAAGQDNTLAADAGMGADVAAQFIAAGGRQNAVVGHTDFCGIMSEVAEDASSSHVDVVL